MKTCLLFFSLLFFITSIALAQTIPITTDSVRMLKEVEIKEVSLEEKAAGFQTQTLDSLAMVSYQTSDLGRLLSYRTPIFLKFYSIAGLASPSFRGTSAGHTQVFWEGVPLNSPTLGQVDFSLFPVGLLDEVNINYGAASLKHGEGGFGGGISLNHRVNRKDDFSFNMLQSVGSFQTFRSLVNTSYTLLDSKKLNIKSTSRFFHKSAKNDYPYNYQGETFRRKRAAITQTGGVQELYFLPSKTSKLHRHEFSTHFWIQGADRELPPPITVPINDESQRDFSFRSLAQWKFKTSKLETKLKAGYLYDFLEYQNENSNIISKTKTQSYHALVEIKYAPSLRWLLQSGLRIRKDIAQVDGYETWQSQHQESLFVSAEYTPSEIFQTTFLARQIMLNGKLQAFLPSLGFAFYQKNLEVKVNTARNFRIPTFNDRYWFPVGNPDLRNEEGWNGEFSTTYHFLNKINKQESKKTQLSVSGLYFWARIQDWILWSPAVAGYWRPENLRSVFSQGLESSMSFKIGNSNFNVETTISYTYTNSKNLEPIRDLDESEGKQLIYTPFHQQKSFFYFNYKSQFLRLEQQFVGRRFTTTTNTEFLPSYFLVNLSFGKTFLFKKLNFTLETNIENIFNYQYQSMAFFPMVGRSFELVLRVRR